MNTTELKVFCTEVSTTINQTQGGQIFMDEIIKDADMLYRYIKLNTLPQDNFTENKKENP